MALEFGNPFDLSGDGEALPSIMGASMPMAMTPAPGVQVASASPTEDEMRAYIKAAAVKRGIDPNIAQTVASGEGGWKNPFQHGVGPAPKSQDPSFGKLENSYGPYQLYISGGNAGLGDQALAAGIDPRKDWKAGVDFALDHAAQHGWDEWYGAKAKGITGMMGIHGGGSPAAPVGHQAAISEASQANNPDAGSAQTANNTSVCPPAVDSDARTALMRMMLAASLANVRLQPVDYDPYKVMPHMQY